MFEKDIEKLIGDMTSFYQEHLPMDSSYEKILNAYIQSFLALWQEATYLRQHLALETAPTLKTIKYSKVDIKQALYTKMDAKRLERLSTLEEKINELNKMKAYTTFQFNESGSRVPIVYDMNLKVKFMDTTTLSLYDDYFIRNNRLYILPTYILNTDQQAEEFHAFDIQIDNLMIEKKWGTYFDIETGPLLPRFKYRDVISAFRRLLTSNLSIREMKDAVRLATDWQEFDILDRHSPHLHPNIKKLYDDWMISPARFIVSLPEELISEKMYLNILLGLMDESKEAQINYLVLFHIIRRDPWQGDDAYVPTINMGLREIFQPEENSKQFLTMRTEDSLFPQNRYDVGRHYDFKLQYDTQDTSHLEPLMDAGEYVIFDDPQLTMDTPWAYQIEYYRVNHIEFPEIPRNFKGSSKDESLTFTFKTNMDGTTHYELLASDEEYGTYEVVETIENDSSVVENSIIHNASASGMRYYKVRAIAAGDTSLMTLALNGSNL